MQSRDEIRLDVEVIAEKRPAGSESIFATPTPQVEQAFDQIMDEVDIPDYAKAKLKPLFVKAHRSGNPRREVEAIEAVLSDVEWGEAYFGTWKKCFEADEVYPHMWRTRGKALVSDIPQPASTIEEAVAYLRVVDMRQLAVELGIMPDTGRPKKRSEFIALLSATGKTKEIVDAAMPAYLDALNKWRRDREAGKSALLAHTLTMRTYALRDHYKRERLTGVQKLRALDSDCPVERQYAAKFMTGEIDGIPPFFPGDRTSLIVEFEDEI